ncbi:MAG: DUF6472 family protein [Bacillota bacterium]|jgi:hypothetical protein
MGKGYNCEECAYYDYDETEDYYFCSLDLDQDEMERFLRGYTADCPYYKFCPDYYLARKQ